MEQFKIFAIGALTMLVIMALLITCIYAIATGGGFTKTLGIISLLEVINETYLIIKNTRNN